MKPALPHLTLALAQIRRHLPSTGIVAVVGQPEERVELSRHLPGVVDRLRNPLPDGLVILVGDAELLDNEAPEALRFDLHPPPAPTRFHDVLGWLRPSIVTDLGRLSSSITRGGGPRERLLLAEALMRRGELRPARDLLVLLDTETLDALDRSRAHVLRAATGFELGRFQEASAALEALRPMLGSTDPADLSLACRLYRNQGEAIFASALAEEGLKRAGLVVAVAADLWAVTGWMRGSSLQQAGSQVAWAKAATLYLEAGDPGRAALSIEQEASCWSALGKHDRARHRIEEAIRRAQEAGDGGAEALCIGEAARIAQQEGKADRAATLLQTAVALAEAGPEPYIKGRLRNEAAMLYTRDRKRVQPAQIDQAEYLLISALRIFEKAGSARMEATCELGLANIEILRGQMDDAWGHIVLAYRYDRMVHDLDKCADVLNLLSDFALKRGDTRTAVLAGGRSLPLFLRLDRLEEVLHVAERLHGALGRLERKEGAGAAALMAWWAADRVGARSKGDWRRKLQEETGFDTEQARRPEAVPEALATLQSETATVQRAMGRDPLTPMPLADTPEELA